MVSNHCITAAPFVAVTYRINLTPRVVDKTDRDVVDLNLPAPVRAATVMTVGGVYIQNVQNPEALAVYNKNHPLTDSPAPNPRALEDGSLIVRLFFTKGEDGKWSNKSNKDPRQFVVDGHLSDQDEALLKEVMTEFSKLNV